MESLDETCAESQMPEVTSTEIQQIPEINNKEKISNGPTKMSETLKLTCNNVETSANEANDQHLDTIMLSNGKPLKGILKHRHHSGAQTTIHTKHTINILEGGTKISESDEMESSSSEKPAASTNDIVYNSDSLIPPQNG